MINKLQAYGLFWLLQASTSTVHAADTTPPSPSADSKTRPTPARDNSWTDSDSPALPAASSQTPESKAPPASSPRPAQPAPAAPVAQYAPVQPAPAAAQPEEGQWVYSDQYGWIWIPYAKTYTYVTPAGSPYEYVYYPTFGWRWVYAPWVFEWGPTPYWGIYGRARFAWYAHPWFARPVYRGGYAGGGYRGGGFVGGGYRGGAFHGGGRRGHR